MDRVPFVGYVIKVPIIIIRIYLMSRHSDMDDGIGGESGRQRNPRSVGPSTGVTR